jgi:hypothetical protein
MPIKHRGNSGGTPGRSAASTDGGYQLASSINAMHLKNRFGDVETESWGINSAHIFGTQVPVEEPSTASKGDILPVSYHREAELI